MTDSSFTVHLPSTLFSFSGDPLPLASLRLLVPPLQLMAASMWQVLKKQDIMNYWKVAEFVSLVMDMVPELLMYKHRTHLNLGLRARVGTSGGHKALTTNVTFILVFCFNCKVKSLFSSPHQYILELCRSEQPVEPDFILSHLENIKPRHPTLVDVSVYSVDQLISINTLITITFL